MNPKGKQLDASQKLTKSNGNRVAFSDNLACPLGSITIKVTPLIVVITNSGPVKAQKPHAKLKISNFYSKMFGQG